MLRFHKLGKRCLQFRMLVNQCHHLLAHLLGLVSDVRPMGHPTPAHKAAGGWVLNKVGFAYAPSYVTSNGVPVETLDVKLSTVVQDVEELIEIRLSLVYLVAQETQRWCAVDDNFVEGIDVLVADDLGQASLRYGEQQNCAREEKPGCVDR